MCVQFPWFKLVAVKVTIAEKTKQWTGLVLLKYPLDYLYKFLQEYDINDYKISVVSIMLHFVAFKMSLCLSLFIDKTSVEHLS